MEKYNEQEHVSNTATPDCSDAANQSETIEALEKYELRYSDCYQGCGGEDCACCEIHADHMNECSYDASDDYYDDEPPEHTECREDCERCEWRNTCEFYEEEDLDERAVVESEFMDAEALDEEA